MITSLSLKNWKSHLDSELAFSEGTNTLVGIMGSGKTSVLDGICFALFGTFPILQSKKIKIEDIIMKKPHMQQQAEVSIKLQIGNDNYSIKRVVSRTRSTSAELRKNGKLIESPQPQKVNEEINKILKMDYDLFTRAIYSEQNQLDMFLTIPKGQRMKKIDEILAIDKFETARSTVISVLNKFRVSIAEKQRLLKPMEAEDTINVLSSLKKEVSDGKSKKSLLLKEALSVKEQRSKAQKRLDDLRFQEKKAREVQETISNSKALMGALQDEIEKMKEGLMEHSEKTDQNLVEEKNKVAAEMSFFGENLKSERAKLDSTTQIYVSKKSKLTAIEEEKLPSLKEKLDEKRRMQKKLSQYPLKKIEEKTEEAKSTLEKTRSMAEKFGARIESIQESLVELDTAGRSCPICDQELSETKKKNLIKKKNSQIKRIESSLETKKLDVERIQEELKALDIRRREIEIMELKLKDFENVEKEISFLNDAIKQLSVEVLEHENEKKMLEKAISLTEKRKEDVQGSLNSILNVISKRNEIYEKQKKVKDLQKDMVFLQEEKFKLFNVPSNLISEAEGEVQRLFGIEQKISGSAEGLDALIAEKEKRVFELENKKNLIEKMKAEVSYLDGRASQLELLGSALVATQDQLRRNFVSAVNLTMHKIWEHMYPYKDFSSVRLYVDDNDYTLQLNDSTGWIPADGHASGGERAVACLALRIAFGLVLTPQLRWLVLDEPTHNLDKNAVTELANVFRERIKDFSDQVFLITHDPALEEAVTGFSYKLERAKESDGPTKVIKVSEPEGNNAFGL